MFWKRNKYKEVAHLIQEADREAQLVRLGKLRRRGSISRLVGNLLILTGLLILLGIGGWYGYNYISNEQYKQAIASKYGSPEEYQPPTPAAPETAGTTEPTVAPVAAAPNLQGNGAAGVQEIVSRLPIQTDNSPPVRLVIPRVGIDSEVVPVTWEMIPSPSGAARAEWQVADYAVGHHYGSANPGQVGNVVLSGHVDYKGQVFRELHRVDRGDEVTVYTEKGQYLYVVQAIYIVKEEGVPEEQRRENAKFMNPTPDQTLTMITCYPYGIDDHRLIVIAKPYQSALSTQSEFKIR